jgi:hypothetical protein
MSNTWRPGEIVVEIGGKNGAPCLFKPLNLVLRGRWSPRMMPNPSARRTGFSAMPDCPGIMVGLDAVKRTLRTVDPLGLPEHKKTLDKINEVAKKWMGEQGPCENTRAAGLKHGQIKSALWEMSEMVRAGTATVVHGTLPSPEKIMAMDGRLRTRNTFLLEGESFYASEEEEQEILEAVVQR